MTSAYDKAQIEQLDMRLSQMIDDCALMKVEIGLLRAMVQLPTTITPRQIDELKNHPGESWQTEDVQPLFDSAGFWVCDRLVTL